MTQTIKGIQVKISTLSILLLFLPLLLWGETVQLTDNAVDDTAPSISDGKIAWQGPDDDGDLEIWYWDGTSTIQITNNTQNDDSPSLDQGEISWEGDDGSDYEIYYWNGTITTKITDNTIDDTKPSLQNGMIAWVGNTVDAVTPLSIGPDNMKSIFGSIAFVLGGIGIQSARTGDEIYYWDGTTTYQLTDNSENDHSPSVYAGEIAWVGPAYEIYHWNGANTVSITDNELDENAPSLFGGKVAYSGYDGSDYEIFYWNGSTTVQVTNNSQDDMAPSLGDAPFATVMVVWTAEDGEIYYWDGTTVSRLTSDGIPKTNPSLSNGRVVWEGYDGNDYEIYYADIPEPSSEDDDDDGSSGGDSSGGGSSGSSNRAPNAVDDLYETYADTVLNVTAPGLLENDSDPDGDTLAIRFFDAESIHGAVININDDGSFTYDPTTVAEFSALSGEDILSDTFTYTVTDGQGNYATATVSVTIQVNPQGGTSNMDPIAEDDTYEITADTLLDVDAPGVMDNDYDPDGDTLTVSAFDRESLFGAIVSVDADGKFRYDPTAVSDFSLIEEGNILEDTFTYTVEDGQGGAATATVTIQVGPGDINEMPLAMDDTYQTDADTVLVVDAPGVMENDSDPDLDTLSITDYDTVSEQGASVSISEDGGVRYDPSGVSLFQFLIEGKIQNDAFTYTVSDGQGGQATATVTIIVSGAASDDDDPFVAPRVKLYDGSCFIGSLFE